MPNRNDRNRNEDQDQQPAISRTRSRRRIQDQGPDLRETRSADMEPSIARQPMQQAAVQEQPTAWEEFLDKLEPFFQEVGDKVRVLDRAGWVKVENPTTGHKLYFNKGVTGVTRVESSLSPDAVKGAAPPEFYNGRITSIIPPTVQAVGEAIRVIAQVQDRLAAPRRRTRDIG